MKNKKIRYAFIPMPTHLDDSWLLNEDEKAILRRLIRLGSRGWFYGDKKFANILGIGPRHFKRAKYRLQMLGLIRIQKRTAQLSTLYFEEDIENWRLTDEVATKFKVDHEKMSLGPLQFKREPFRSKQHFENTFANAFPRFAEGRKGRLKYTADIESVGPDDFSTDTPEIATEPITKPSPFEKRLEKFNPSDELKIFSDYYSYRSRIEECKEIPSQDKFEQRFFELLDGCARHLIENPPDTIKSMLDEIKIRFQQGESDFSIVNYIEKTRLERKRVETEVKSSMTVEPA